MFLSPKLPNLKLKNLKTQFVGILVTVVAAITFQAMQLIVIAISPINAAVGVIILWSRSGSNIRGDKDETN